MESMQELMSAHLNANRLEKEIKKIRGNLIKAFKNNSFSDLYLLKIAYTGFAVQLNKETATFNKLLQDLDENTFISADSAITDNIDYETSSMISQEKELINEVYDDNNNDSVPVIPVQPEEEEEEEDKKDIHLTELYNDSVSIANDNVCDNNIEIKMEEEKEIIVRKPWPTKPVTRVPAAVQKKANISGTNRIRPTIANYTKGAPIRASVGRYKYSGNGFTVFTGYKNRCKPIYNSTTLFCQETCNGNKSKLINYLIKFGRFKQEMIEEITFKTRGLYGDSYALIRVRGPAKYIKNKMKKLIKAKGAHIISIKRFSKSSVNREYECSKLYVNNFDILSANAHKKFTALFFKYGDLLKDIQMGLDRNSDPYAIVHFKHLANAQNCIQSQYSFEKQLKFGGKVLSISYSKF